MSGGILSWIHIETKPLQNFQQDPLNENQSMYSCQRQLNRFHTINITTKYTLSINKRL